MDVTATYCLADDFLLGLGRREPPERAVSDAEVLTVALVAARTYDGNFEAAWRFPPRTRLHGPPPQPGPIQPTPLRRAPAGRAALPVAR